MTLFFFLFLDCKYSGLPCSDPAEEGRQRGVLHEHPEHCSAGAEVGLLTCGTIVSCPKYNVPIICVLVLSQVPQWNPWVHEVCGPGCAETISPGGDAVPAR